MRELLPVPMSLRDVFKGIALLVCLSFALGACGGDAVSPGADGPDAEPPIVAAPDPVDEPAENPIEQPAEPDPLPPPPEGTPLPPPSSVVLSIVSEGGFVPVERALGRLPTMVVYEDGTIVQPGPVPEIYPGSLLKPLEAGRLADGANSLGEAECAGHRSSSSSRAVTRTPASDV